MFAWWGTVATRLRWSIVAFAVAFIAFSGVWGTGVFDELTGSSSLDDPASESQIINPRVIDDLGRQNTDIIALYSSPTLTVPDPAFRDAVTAVVTRIRA